MYAQKTSRTLEKWLSILLNLILPLILPTIMTFDGCNRSNSLSIYEITFLLHNKLYQIMYKSDCNVPKITNTFLFLKHINQLKPLLQKPLRNICLIQTIH